MSDPTPGRPDFTPPPTSHPNEVRPGRPVPQPYGGYLPVAPTDPPRRVRTGWLGLPLIALWLVLQPMVIEWYRQDYLIAFTRYSPRVLVLAAITTALLLGGVTLLVRTRATSLIASVIAIALGVVGVAAPLTLWLLVAQLRLGASPSVGEVIAMPAVIGVTLTLGIALLGRPDSRWGPAALGIVAGLAAGPLSLLLLSEGLRLYQRTFVRMDGAISEQTVIVLGLAVLTGLTILLGRRAPAILVGWGGLLIAVNLVTLFSPALPAGPWAQQLLTLSSLSILAGFGATMAGIGLGAILRPNRRRAG
ncbi:MAG: hypothetical protein QM804_09790 [Propionicimonas sp.]